MSDSTQKIYYENGKLKMVIIIKDGIRISRKTYDKQGTLIKEE